MENNLCKSRVSVTVSSFIVPLYYLNCAHWVVRSAAGCEEELKPK